MGPVVQRLVGTWRGPGRGDYPTIAPFAYVEEVTFGATPKGFLTYQQRSWLDDGTPAHVETGYLRALAGGAVELLVVQPTGITEIHTGSFVDGVLDLRCLGVGTSPTAKAVHDVHRMLVLRDDTLSTRLDLAAVGQPMTFHLESLLTRVARPE